MVTFEDFWQVYPRKVGKLAAKREWERLKPDAETLAQMEATLAWQLTQWTERRFTPHPKTWLHQGRWLDEPPPILAGGYVPWTCPHVEHCAHRAMCEVKLACGALRYPVKES